MVRLPRSLSKLRSVWHMGMRVSPQRALDVTELVSDGSSPRANYFLMNGSAAVIASLGLILNSAPVVIGAMLVSPLMMPIYGIALGMARQDTPLFLKSVRAEVYGVILVIAVGYLIGQLPLHHEPTPEILARIHPNLLDLLVALSAGLAGTLALIDPKISPSLPGVAVAIAIIPPLAVCGLCVAMGGYQAAQGAFLLFLANFIGILIVAYMVFVKGGVGSAVRQGRARIVRTLSLPTAVFVVMVIFLTVALSQVTERRMQLYAINEVLRSYQAEFPPFDLMSVNHERDGDELRVLAVVRTPRELTPKRVKEFQDHLAEELDMPVKLIVRCSITKEISPTGGSGSIHVANYDGVQLADDATGDMRLAAMAEQVLREQLEVRPDAILQDVTVAEYLGNRVVSATVQSHTPITPRLVGVYQTEIRKRLSDKKALLYLRWNEPQDMTAQGKVIFARARFAPRSDDEVRLIAEVRKIAAEEKGFIVSSIEPIRQKDHWDIVAEVVGRRILTSDDIATIEGRISAGVGLPVRLVIMSRAELVVTANKMISPDQYMQELDIKVQAKLEERRKAENGDATTRPRSIKGIKKPSGFKQFNEDKLPKPPKARKNPKAPTTQPAAAVDLAG